MVSSFITSKNKMDKSREMPPRLPAKIEIGDFEVDTWYSAPYPLEYVKEGEKLYICEFCLSYMASTYTLSRHNVSSKTSQIHLLPNLISNLSSSLPLFLSSSLVPSTTIRVNASTGVHLPTRSIALSITLDPWAKQNSASMRLTDLRANSIVRICVSSRDCS